MIVGWIANVFLIAGILLVGKKWKHAFGLYIVGEVLWAFESVRIQRLDMVFLCVVFAAIAGHNWWVWNKGDEK